MNDFFDEDPKLLNFLHQHRSIAPLEPPELEDRLMCEIDLLPTESSQRVLGNWWRYVFGGIGIITIGIVGVTAHQLMNPPEPSLADLHQLNLYLEAHAHSLIDNPEVGVKNRGSLSDLDLDLFLDNDDDESVES